MATQYGATAQQNREELLYGGTTHKHYHYDEQRKQFTGPQPMFPFTEVNIDEKQQRRGSNEITCSANAQLEYSGRLLYLSMNIYIVRKTELQKDG